MKRAAENEADDSERADRRDESNRVEPTSLSPVPDSLMVGDAGFAQTADKRDL